jgi:hypothetical protein
MKTWIRVVAITALVCVTLTTPALSTTNVSGGAALVVVFLAGWALSLTAGVLGAVHAGSLRRPGWTGLFALVTGAAVVGSSAGLLEVFVSDNSDVGPSASTLNQMFALVFVSLATPPAAALLSTYLLRPREPKSAEPPAGGQ